MLSLCLQFLYLYISGELIFWAAAILGSVIFGVRMIFSCISGVVEGDDIDFDYADGMMHHQPSLKLFTLHSLSGFFMMFGWTGLAGIHQWGLSPEQSMWAAFAAGLAMFLATVLLMRGALLLESPGEQFVPRMAVGKVATVYQRIPANGQGKIHVVVDNIRRELLAQSQEGKAYESFTFVKIVRVIDQETVEVVAY